MHVNVRSRASFVALIFAAVLAQSGCGGSGATRSGSGVPPSSAVMAACSAYGAQVHRDAVNENKTTAGEVARQLAARHAATAPWSALPAATEVGYCEFPTPGGPELKKCKGSSVMIDAGLFAEWLDAAGHRSRVPTALLASAC
jgi:hypothetical protein